MTIDAVWQAVGWAWDLLFAKGGDKDVGKGVVIRFLALLGDYPIMLLPLGFYLVILGIKSARRLISGY